MSIEYRSPEKAKENGDPPFHHFELFEEGVVIGGADVDYYSSPLPLYQVSSLWVDPAHQGKGEGSRILERVEEWLKQRGKPGVIVEAVPEDAPTKGMYERRGWIPVPGEPDLFVYNWPTNADLKIMIGYGMR